MLHVYDNNGHRLLKITRQTQHHFGRSKAFVYAYPPGEAPIVLLGSVQENRSLFRRRYDVFLASDDKLETFGRLWSPFRRWEYVFYDKTMSGIAVKRVSKGCVCVRSN